MSREVPRDRPLSEEDREYLLARGYDDTVAMIDQNYPGSGTPSEVTDGSVVDDDDDNDSDDYDEWTGKELEDELKRRQLPSSGTNDQKIARLRSDDAARMQQ